MYRELPVPASLSPYLECFWRREVLDRDDGSLVLPDGRVDLVWLADLEPLVAGPQTTSIARPHTPPGVVFGARFHPSIAPQLLGVPAHELVDQHVPLTSLDSGRAASLARRLPTTGDPQGAASAIAAELARWTGRAEPPDPVVAAAARLLDDPSATVEGVAHEVALSERELRRRFRESVGYGPKVLQRILRFQRALAGLASGSDPLARLSTSAGYADQAHMTREMRRLARATPIELAKAWRT